MNQGEKHNRLLATLAGFGLAMLLAINGWMIFLFAPSEVTMGDVQRIVYLHVSVAWCGLAGCVAMGVSGALYLVKRLPRWDHWSLAAAEIGWLCTTLTLVTGSLWAHEAWNTWWTWEPRLTSSVVLWTFYAGYFLVRASIDEPDRRARVASLLAIIALADVPMIIMATRWFRGIHPVAPEMDTRMRIALWICIVSFTLVFAWLASIRRRQVDLATRLRKLHRGGWKLSPE